MKHIKDTIPVAMDQIKKNAGIMTEKEQVEKLLEESGFACGLADLHDYGRACQIVFKGKIPEYREYERKVKLIREFLGC